MEEVHRLSQGSLSCWDSHEDPTDPQHVLTVGSAQETPAVAILCIAALSVPTECAFALGQWSAVAGGWGGVHVACLCTQTSVVTQIFVSILPFL